MRPTSVRRETRARTMGWKRESRTQRREVEGHTGTQKTRGKGSDNSTTFSRKGEWVFTCKTELAKECTCVSGPLLRMA